MSSIEALIQQLISTVRGNYFVTLNTGKPIVWLDKRKAKSQRLVSTIVAPTILVGYDALLTLQDEIDLVWRSSWSFINVLHLLIRYHGFTYLVTNTYVSISTTLSTSVCKHIFSVILTLTSKFYPYEIWGSVFVVPAADILVVARLYALYNRNYKIGALLAFLWLAELTFLAVFIGTRFTPAVMANPLPGVLTGCFPVINIGVDPKIIQGAAIAITVQGLYLGLSLNVFFRRVRTAMSPFLQIFFRDGTLYCLVLLVMYIVNILFLVYAQNSPLQTIGQQWLVSVVTAGRMVLNLRSTSRNPNPSYSTRSTSTPGRQGEPEYTEEIELGQYTSVIVIEDPNSPRSTRRPLNRPWSPESLESPWTPSNFPSPSTYRSPSLSSTTLKGQQSYPIIN
ncbi:hypothetical protein M422DRAFT_239609 [Sphaerobolus stellatus SS14]|nr:hypothetical protein M422DRAFT_239609 [Sphaerobolus stellatus SS14]